ncbi:MAG: phenylalanine--tRNA ligase subunit alpha [Epsilonproteobacteria bacterium]|nr:phenylalanine--tRNA ligase subunit alpha [Campylobacterota bacterium]
MENLDQKLRSVQQEFEQALGSASSSKSLEQVRLQFLGKKGEFTQLLATLKDLPIEQKRAFGSQLNQLKQDAQERFEQVKDELIAREVDAANAKQQNFDVTAYKPHAYPGHLHPYSQFVHEIEDIFLSMGYEICQGPEVDSEFYNFSALNIPQDHPARDMYDTFWTTRPDYLLRTHTSTVQIHSLQSKELPLAIVAPGRTYRYEAVDASHDFMFMQCEGLLVDKKVNVSHLFGTAQTFLKTLFGKDELDIRIRPGFFPFVEPGFEIDMRCPFCSKGCGVCKHTTWIEVFPGGLVHPNVLRACNIDPEEYSGFAFGFGLTRLAMLKYGIDDIRLFHSGRVAFLKQF